MEIAKVVVNDVYAMAINRKPIPAGIVGATVTLEFGDSWDGLVKTVVFRGAVTRDVLLNGNVAPVPVEVVAKPGVRLEVGVYGINGDGLPGIPTLWADLGVIRDAANPSGDESTDPALPVWAQLQAMIGDLSQLTTEAKSSLEAAVKELAERLGGKVDQKEIQDLVDSALRSAKESGEFDGEDAGLSMKYGVSDSPTTEPRTWSDTIPEMTASMRYLWASVNIRSGTEMSSRHGVIGVYGEKGESGTFWAKYGTTTYAEIEEAHKAGKLCLCDYGNGKILVLYALYDMTAYFSVCNQNTGAMVCSVSADGWTTEKKELAQVFIAEYGVTTNVQIYSARDAGKIVFCKKDDSPLILPAVFVEGSSYATFSGYSGGYITVWTVAANEWSESSVPLVKTTKITEKSTDDQIPTAKAVAEALANLEASLKPLTVTIGADDAIAYWEEEFYEQFDDYETQEAWHNLFNGLYYSFDTWTVSLNYDDIYTALKSGKAVVFNITAVLPRISELNGGLYLPTKQEANGYLLTPFGLVVWTALFAFVFRNGSFHSPDTDPYVDTDGEAAQTATVVIYDDFSYGEYAGAVTYEVGMTWEQFCDSGYNTQGFYCDDGSVYGKHGSRLYAMGTTDTVNATDLVGAYGAYEYV